MQSLIKSLKVLEMVAEKQPVSVGELAKMMSMPKTTVQRILWTFHEAGWLRLIEGDMPRWAISPRVLSVRPDELTGGGLASAIQEPMAELRNATQETVYVSVYDGSSAVVVIDRLESPHPVRAVSPVGDIAPIHSTANGMAILAFLPELQIEKIINGELNSFNPSTITQPEQLRDELNRVRERGYSINRGYYRAGIFAVGAPVFDAMHQPVASICISMPDSRYREDKIAEWGALTMQAAQSIGLQKNARS
ncbi:MULTISPECIES: IclR family transcriptional regulator [Pantoea]|jgi:IclR family acetate operon transcriptional repressor|uniref:HTH-type transcriptional repressor AllR n=1 Tax=Pantoea piersonii TaxID=2364647 RepID=A0AAJ5UCE7_9GAMM|nr:MULTISPECIES: IclR family transcriptional regulator [Pantoea]MDU6431369.1 IclR family transcriptional regulator [Pantoea sp.]MBZ6384342.1 IclR family transcriptional regulator [Pantoea piersonii]MBZ6399901.1 IclR family transcriptional regulator [Pantoea piersonii]MBZ6406397.1 IclR family transcriptional regulator [Pantoea piersonii]MBZ6425143.1 IclR family transcriptional regulator [Pantoea piersonii]